MRASFSRLGLAVLLIVLVALILLWSDRHSRIGNSVVNSKQQQSLAILMHSSSPLVDEIRNGVLDGLNQRGYKDGERIAITTYNPEGDLPTGNLMAQKIASSQYDVSISISTLMLQALANANKQSHVKHVFGGVTSPVTAGVGITKIGSLDKPSYLTGVGTPQPVADIFRLAKRINPNLTRVGVVWNPTEMNSEVCTNLAREISQELGITLLEASIEQTKDVREAATSLVSRGAQALWAGGDLTVNNAIDSLIGVAHASHIPVFSNITSHASHGGLFDLGANYHEVGIEVARIAADILAGADPATLPVNDFLPRRLVLNYQTLKSLPPAWQFSAELKAQAAEIIDENGQQSVASKPVPALNPAVAKPGRNYQVGVAYFAPEPGIDEVMKGLREGLLLLGYQEGNNLSFKMVHAQSEIAQIPTIGQLLDSSEVDVILTLTTPLLQGAGMTARHKPVVFTYVTDPLAAGAGNSFTEHLPNLTGIGSLPPVAEQVDTLLKVLPNLKTLGTLYNPSEANSVKVATVLRQICQQRQLKLEEVSINTTADVLQAAQALVARQVGAIITVSDNTMYQAFDAVAKVAKDAALPLIVDQSDYLSHDALMMIGVNYQESGRAAAELLGKVLNGVDPKTLPFANVSKLTVALNEDSAKRLQIQFPQSVRQLVTSQSQAAAQPALAHKWKIKRILYVENPPAEESLQGLDDGFRDAGLVAGRDYELTQVSAQSDMALLPTMVDAANSDGTELLITLSTPTLQAAITRVKQIPLIFTLVANPFVTGAGTDDSHHLANLTGVYTLGPYKEMAALVKTHFPQWHTVGTLFSPAEDNSVFSKTIFTEKMQEQGIKVIDLPVNSNNELNDAALALASKPIDAIIQIPDNQSSAGFTAISKAAVRAHKPLFSFTGSGLKQGAALAYTLDYYQAGYDAAIKAAAVMRGQSPAVIPFSRPSKVNLMVNLENARTQGFTIPEAVLKRVDLTH